MSEATLLYLKRAEALVNDASSYIAQCNKTASAADDDLRQTMVREVIGIKVALLAINRQLTVFAATVNRKSPREDVQHEVNREP
jgi:hypothetical protein